jgi:hypothetical protein
MKTLLNSSAIFLLLLFMVPLDSNAQKDKYVIVDLYTGEAIDVYYDTVSWRTMNKVSNMPVDYYVIRYSDNTTIPDTVHGVTGIIVNDLIVKNSDGKWMLDEARVKWDGTEFKMKDKYGRKVKWVDGTLKIKDWNSKYKSEKGDDTKYKKEWDKIKWKDDEVKTEVGTKKTKVQQ